MQIHTKYWGLKKGIFIFIDKVHFFGEGQKILQNLLRRFVLGSNGQIYGGDSAKLCGLLRIHELWCCGGFDKVHIFWEGHKILRNRSSPYFWLALHMTKVSWRFRKTWWPSQNTYMSFIGSSALFSDFLAILCVTFVIGR